MAGSKDAYRRLQARRSTLLAVGGVVLVVIAVLLTLTEVGGNLLPTVMALAGVGLVIAGTAVGLRLVVDNFRYHRDQSYYDDE